MDTAESQVASGTSTGAGATAQSHAQNTPSDLSEVDGGTDNDFKWPTFSDDKSRDKFHSGIRQIRVLVGEANMRLSNNGFRPGDDKDYQKLEQATTTFFELGPDDRRYEESKTDCIKRVEAILKRFCPNEGQ